MTTRIQHGTDVLHNPKINRSTGYTEAERKALGLVGLVPDVTESIETQLSRVLLQLEEKATDLDRFIYLMNLLDTNETLFYRTLMSDPARFFDIVYDPIGGKVGEDSLRCLAWGGRLLILGFLGGGPSTIRSNYLLIKGIDAIGVRIGGLNEADPDLAKANMAALIALAEKGRLRPRISHTFPLKQAAEALQVVIDRAVIGKAVLLS